MEVEPCIVGHKHTDSATQHDINSPVYCLSCGKEFSSYKELQESEVHNASPISEKH